MRPLDRVGEPPEAVELQLEQPPIAVERLLAADGDDGGDVHGCLNLLRTSSRLMMSPLMKPIKHIMAIISLLF